MTHDLAPQSAIQTTHDAYSQVKAAALGSLKSARSRRVYDDTYSKWENWCSNQRIDPLAFDYIHVKPFIESDAATQATGNRMLSAMRTLARTAVLELPQAPEFERLYTRLKTWRTLRIERKDHALKREKHVLTAEQVYKVIEHWSDDGLQALRNRTLMRVLFYAGLRRFEAAALRWETVDLERGLITVSGGKGRTEDETDTVPLLTADALDDVRNWREHCPSDYVFPVIRRGGHIQDRPINGETVRRIVKETQVAVGVEFNPHDARRTIITMLIDAGNSIKDVQSFARHKHAATTMIYAEKREAAQLGERLKL